MQGRDFDDKEFDAIASEFSSWATENPQSFEESSRLEELLGLLRRREQSVRAIFDQLDQANSSAEESVLKAAIEKYEEEVRAAVDKALPLLPPDRLEKIQQRVNKMFKMFKTSSS